MTQTDTRPAAQHPLFDLSALAAPGLALLRAELLALEQLLPGHAPGHAPNDVDADFDARFEAEADNLPV